MRVIWLKSDYVDPPDTGGKLRTYNLLRELHKRCEVHYISLNSSSLENESESDWASRIVTFFRKEEKKSGIAFYLRLLGRVFTQYPYIVQKYLSRQILDTQELMRSASTNGKPTAQEQTVLICDFLEMAGNVAWSTSWPKILFQHNVESVIWRRYFENEKNWLKRAYFWFEFQRLSRYERKTCNRFDLVLAVSDRDRKTFESMGVTAPIEVIETGVDTEFFAPQQDVSPIPYKLLFLGSLDWMPNIDGLQWFATNIYPQIKQACPQVSLDIVGRRPTSSITSLQVKDKSIRVIGDVPDVRPFLAASHLFLVPLRVGSGTRLKIFEAMAMRRPVVSTTIGAEGLPVRSGEHIILADSPESFAEKVVELLNNPAKENLIAENGYRLVTEKYSWKNVSQRLFEVCDRTLGAPV